MRPIIMLRIIFAQIIVCALTLTTISGFCVEEDYGYSLSDYNERLERLQIYFETEMYEEASLLLNELIVEFPDEPSYEYLKGIVDYQRQDYERAEKVFIEFIQEHPDVAEPYYLLAEINLKKEDPDIAREYLTKYCELVPEDYVAHHKLNSLITDTDSSEIIIIKDGREDSTLVKKVGFYGACVYARNTHSIKLINGSFRSWSSMGIDFAYPLDLRGKNIVIKLKGKQGGERLELTFRDEFAKDYNPQLVLEPEGEELSCNWQKIKVTLDGHQPKIDLSSIVHIGLEFGSSTVQNPTNSTLFVKDIVIEDVHN